MLALTSAWEESDRARSEIAGGGRVDRRVPRRAGAGGGRATHTVTYDRYSFSLDGHRVWLWSAEFHYYRLPNPDLWRDQLEKLKAAGFNAVSLYFSWAYHSPAPGVFDFSRRARRRPAARHRRRRSAST